MAGIPDFAPPLPDRLMSPPVVGEDYGRLEHVTGPASHRPNNLHFDTPASGGGGGGGGVAGYNRMDRGRAKSPMVSRSPRSSPPDHDTPPSRRRENNLSPAVEVPPPIPAHHPEEYGRLERTGGGGRGPVGVARGGGGPASPPQQLPMRPSKPGYEDIDLDDPSRGNGTGPSTSNSKPPPPITVKPSRPGYEDIDLDSPPPPAAAAGASASTQGGVSNGGRSHVPVRPSKPGYEDIDADLANGLLQEYGKLDRGERNKSPFPLHLQPQSREKSKSPVLGRRAGGKPPPKPAPYIAGGGGDGHLSPPEPKKPPQMPPTSNGDRHVQEEYGRLDHTPSNPSDDYDIVEGVEGVGGAQVVHPEQYTKLSRSNAHFAGAPPPAHEEYGRLKKDPSPSSSSAAPSRDRFGGSLKQSGNSSPAVIEGSEGKGTGRTRHTVHNQIHTKHPPGVGVRPGGGATGGGNQQPPPQPEEYGRLDRGPASSSSSSSSPSSSFGKGDAKRKWAAHKSVPFLQQVSKDGYGHLERTGRSNFDPYSTGSLSSDPEPERTSITSNSSADSVTRLAMDGLGEAELEEENGGVGIYSTISNTEESKTEKNPTGPIYSTVQKPRKKKRNHAPPPGYENATPLGTTSAQLAAHAPTTTPGGGGSRIPATPPAVPPRAGEKAKHGYENIGEDGRVFVDKQSSQDLPPALISRQSPTENDYIEGLERFVGGASHASQPAELSSLGGGAGNKPTPAPKPKVKPKPKQRSVS